MQTIRIKSKLASWYLWSLKVLILALMTLLAASCERSEPASESETAITQRSADAISSPRNFQLRSMGSCEDYAEHLADSLFGYWTQQLALFGRHYSMINSPPQYIPVQSPSENLLANIQQKGDDEADLAKASSDGTLYIIHRQKLHIERGSPPESLTRLSSLDLGVSSVQDMYYDEIKHRLVLFARLTPVLFITNVNPDYYTGNIPQVIFVDVQNPEAPVITARLRLKGLPIDSRRVGSRIHLVLSTAPPPPYSLGLGSDFQAYFFSNERDDFRELLLAYDEARQLLELDAAKKQEITATLNQLEALIKTEIKTALDTLGIQNILPRATWEIGGQLINNPLLACTDIKRPGTGIGAGLQIFSSFDTDGGNFQATAVAGQSGILYARPDAFYLANNLYAEFESRVHIHKFSLNEANTIYRASGSVTGSVNNQYSLSESQGFLRLVTANRNPAPDSTLSSSVFVLHDNGAGELVVHGQVQDIAPNEQVFSARWTDNRGYLFTYRENDPLFAVDLSDPSKPELAGALDIPILNRYIQPLGDTHLLVVRSQLQLFDVTNLSAPQLAFSHNVFPDSNWRWSGAVYDHLSFTYYAPRQLLTLPVRNYGEPAFNGFGLYHIDPASGITELGRVDHKDLAYQSVCLDPTVDPSSYNYYCDSNDRYINLATPKRSLFMTSDTKTYLYSISWSGLKVNDVDYPAVTLGQDVFEWP